MVTAIRSDRWKCSFDCVPQFVAVRYLCSSGGISDYRAFQESEDRVVVSRIFIFVFVVVLLNCFAT